jgi:hypothetical protein
MPTAFADMRCVALSEPDVRWHWPRLTSVCLGSCAPHVLGPRTFRPLAKVEFDAVALSQILETFTIHGASVKEVLLPRVILDEPEPLFRSYRSNLSRHHASLFSSVSTFEKPQGT